MTIAGGAVREDRIAFDSGELERRREAVEHLLDQLGDDPARVLELRAGEESGVAGDVREDEIALTDTRRLYPSAAATVLPSVTVETFCSA